MVLTPTGPFLIFLAVLSAFVRFAFAAGPVAEQHLGDTATLVDPSQWYDASQHVDYWIDFGRQWSGIQDLHGLDIFSGRHGRTAAAMQKCAFRSVVYDICHGGLKHDITSVEGFETLMLLALRLLPFALVMLGPPCSMFVYMSSSQHLRHLFGPSGHPRDVATQLGNRIANNTAAFLSIMKAVRGPRGIWVVLEQSKSSWMPKLPSMSALFSSHCFIKVSTHLCFWGHDLEKPMSLFGDLPGLESLKRVMTRTARAKYADIRSRKNQRRKEPKIYYVKKGDRVNGTKLPAETATYPKRFCTALVKLWAGAVRMAGHP